MKSNGTSPKLGVHDLVYLNSQEEYDTVRVAILNRYPQAKIEEASDEIHEFRFQVELPTVDEREFFNWALREGFAFKCLRIQLCLRIDTPAWMKEDAEKFLRERNKK